MRAIRVYKISVRENILRQIVFTDRNLFYIACATLTYLLWQFIGEAPIDIKVFISFVLCGGLLLIASIRIDRQPLITILRRILTYLISKKKYRF